MSSRSKNKIPILSFYSGGGFLDMGFEMAGFKIVWTNEVDKDFAKFHAAGITSWRRSRGDKKKAEIFNTKSITEITSKEIVSEAFPAGKPEDFGIIGGPPCQDFSINGNLEGFEGERGKLTVLFFDKIMELLPTFFVMENVTGLIRSESTKEHLETLLDRIRTRYYLDHETLNALEFGVPQSRERVFFVGIRKDRIDRQTVACVPNGVWFPFPVNTKYQGAAKKYKWPKVTRFGRRLSKPKGIPLKLCVESCLVPANREKRVANADERFNLYKSMSELRRIGEGRTNRPSFKRLHRFKFSPTACYGNNEVHLHPNRQKRLSVRETLRIQGVPDSYRLPKKDLLSKKFKMIGNGVPVPLAEAVASALKSYLEFNYVIPE